MSGAAATQSGGNSRITRGKCDCTRVCERQLSFSWKQTFFSLSLSYTETQAAFLPLCTSTDTMKKKGGISYIHIHLLRSPSFSHTCTRSLSLSLSVWLLQAACLCLFLEAHNMADMCFVIVSTTSSHLAYKDCSLHPYTHPIPPYTTQHP